MSQRNAAIAVCKEVVNENDETRKRFEVMCREVFKKFKACITIKKVNEQLAEVSIDDHGQDSARNG